MNKFELEVPQENHEEPKKQNKKERINKLRGSIKTQYNEMYKSQDLDITKQNQKKIEDLVFATQDLIDNCIKDKNYSGNKDETFVNLIYICHKLDLKLETYKLTEKMQELESKSKELTEKQNNAEERNNNLVYNLLGFLASFSVVSAAVAAIENVEGTLNIMLVIAFAVFLLLTTLIGLHNFYKNDNKRESKLQDNYFLWKATGIIIAILMVLSGMNCIKNNKDKIFNYLDGKIENLIEEKVNNKLQEN